MILTYGSYSHADGECKIEITGGSIDQEETHVGNRVVWTIEGKLHGDTQSELVAAVAALNSAYSQDGKDLTFKYTDGTVLHQLLNRDTINGIRILGGVQYPSGDGAEGTTYRTYRIVVSADVQLLAVGGQSLVSFTETLEFFGGGPVTAYQEYLDARPELQTLQRYSPYYALQTGTAVGASGYYKSSPHWPDKEMRPQRRTGKDTPKRQQVGSVREYTSYANRWSYQFHSAEPFVGDPDRWK